jgi:hypothetical protein
MNRAFRLNQRFLQDFRKYPPSLIFGRLPACGVAGCFAAIFSFQSKDFRYTPWRRVCLQTGNTFGIQKKLLLKMRNRLKKKLNPGFQLQSSENFFQICL